MKCKFFLIIAGLFFMGPLLLWAHEEIPVKPGPKDKCPVCGMFVAKYPDFVAALTLEDGSQVFFDGVKDMMRYLNNLQRYAPSIKREDIVEIQVTDYYRLVAIDGLKAFYVEGSNIYGPMGKELIPFETEEDAKEFLKDHIGNTVLRFQEIHKDVLNRLD